MEYSFLPFVATFFFGSACGALVVSLQRHVNRKRILDEFERDLRNREPASFHTDHSAPSGVWRVYESRRARGVNRLTESVAND